MSLKSLFYWNCQIPSSKRDLGSKREQSAGEHRTGRCFYLPLPWSTLWPQSEVSFEGTVLSSVTWCHNLDPICICKPKCFSQNPKSLHTELFIDASDMDWVLSQQLWRGKKESTCEGQPGWHIVPVLLILVPVHPVPHLPSVCLCWAQSHWQELPGHCLVLPFPLLQKQ